MLLLTTRHTTHPSPQRRPHRRPRGTTTRPPTPRLQAPSDRRTGPATTATAAAARQRQRSRTRRRRWRPTVAATALGHRRRRRWGRSRAGVEQGWRVFKDSRASGEEGCCVLWKGRRVLRKPSACDENLKYFGLLVPMLWPMSGKPARRQPLSRQNSSNSGAAPKICKL